MTNIDFNLIFGYVISVSSVFLFYSYILICFIKSGVISNVRTYSLKSLVLCFFVGICAVILACSLINRNQHFIYFYDSTMHWIPAVILSDYLFSNPLGAVNTVISTIFTSDYNWSMPVLFSFFTRLFGKEYSEVVISAFCLYIIPALFVIGVIIQDLCLKVFKSTLKIEFIFLIICLTPLFYNVTLKGFLDGPVLLLSSILILLAYRFDFSKFDYFSCILIAIGLSLLFVFRRHYAYWIVAYIFFISLRGLYEINLKGLVPLKNSICSFLLISVICVLIFALPLREYIIFSLKDYESIYGPWNDTIENKLKVMFSTLGVLPLIFSVSLVIIMLYLKNKSVSFILSALIFIFVPSLLMSRSVSMHDAHYFLIIFPILSITCLGFVVINLHCNRIFFFVKLLLLSLLTINFFIFYNPSVFGNKILNGFNENFFKIASFKTLTRNDIPVIKSIVSDLNELTVKYDTNVYICAGTNILNYCILQYALQPSTFLAIPKSLYPSQADLRDGFSTSFFDAGIVIIDSPNPDLSIFHTTSYGVFEYLSAEIEKSDSSIGKHYELVKSYDLSEGHGAKIYRKVSDYTLEDFDLILDFYDNEFSNYKSLFSDRIRNYIKEKY